MTTANVGIVSPVIKGAWDDDTEYNRLNIVHGSDGATYQAIQTVPAGTALSNTTYWMQITPKAPVIGTVTDVAFDAGASVTNSGTAMAPVLDFEIPRGVAGNESIDDTKGEGDTDYVWSADKLVGQFSKAYLNAGSLANNTDLNNVKDQGVYQLLSQRTYSNLPADTTSSILIVNRFTTGIVNQVCIRYGNGSYSYRYFQNDSWSAWKFVPAIVDSSSSAQTTWSSTKIKNSTQTKSNDLASNSDLDDLTANAFYLLADSRSYTNSPLPSNQAGTLIIYNLTTISNIEYSMQICINWSSGEIYVRRHNANGWSSWIKSSCIQSEKDEFLTNKGTLSSSGDADDISANAFYSVPTNANPDNYPLGDAAGLILNTKLYNSSDYKQQIAFPYFVNSNTIAARHNYGIFAREYYSSSWRNWKYFKLTARNYSGKYYAFGDSTTWGYSSDYDHAQSPWNYPAIVGDLIGVDVHNLADPAQGLIKDWNVGTTGNFAIIPTINQMIEDGDFDDTVLITVGWAYNDGSYYGSLNFGAPTDPVPESTEGITTYLGYYSKILDILQKAAPKATVILVTGYGSPDAVEGRATCRRQFTNQITFLDGKKTYKEIYDAMEEMANLNGYCCVNQAKGCVINKANASTIIGDNIHPTYVNYRIYGNNLSSRIVSYFQNL